MSFVATGHTCIITGSGAHITETSLLQTRIETEAAALFPPEIARPLFLELEENSGLFVRCTTILPANSKRENMTMNWSSDITWMRGLLILAVTLFTAAGALAGEAGGPSAIQLVSGETGLGAFFTEDGTASPEDWGKNTSGGGPATVTNGVMIVGAATNNYRDFAPTLDSNQSTVGPLDGSRDWGFEVVFSQGAFGQEVQRR